MSIGKTFVKTRLGTLINYATPRGRVGSHFVTPVLKCMTEGGGEGVQIYVTSFMNGPLAYLMTIVALVATRIMKWICG